MAGAVHQQVPILSVASFRAWLTSRPDEEHWELIGGVPTMMTPPNRRHQRIASNLETLLNAAIKRHDPALAAYQGIGVNIVSAVPYDPEPDVAVIREDENPDPRYADRFYLAAEVLSESDTGVIEGKRDIYRAHPSCTCILLIRQDRVEITVDVRTADGWGSRRRCMAPIRSRCPRSASPVRFGPCTGMRRSAEPDDCCPDGARSAQSGALSLLHRCSRIARRSRRLHAGYAKSRAIATAMRNRRRPWPSPITSAARRSPAVRR